MLSILQTLNFVNNGYLKNGKLADIAPTILKLMDLPIPKEMTGNILIEEQENDEVELDDFKPEDIDWYQIDLMEYLAENQKCCGNCKCGQHDADGDRECCGKCNDKE